jgi:hypothetical protein
MTPEEQRVEMDLAAMEADKDLRSMAHADTVRMARWFARHYAKAGHKRLGRAIVAFAKETKDMRDKDFAPVAGEEVS